MTFKHVQVFVAVCEDMSMTLAAKKLFMTQPQVSRLIAELESEYQVKLFHRINHRLQLTAQGAVLLEDCKKVVADMAQLEYNLAREDIAPRLKVGCSIGIGISYIRKYARLYLDKYPKTVLAITENSGQIIESLVLNNELDLGLVEGIVHSDVLLATPFHKENLAAVCSKDHPLAKEKDRVFTLKELNSQRLSLPDTGTGTRESLNKLAKEGRFTLEPIWSSINFQSHFTNIESGNCVAIISRHLVSDKIASGEYVELKTDFTVERTFTIIRRKDKYMPINARYFMSLWEDLKN